TQPQGPSTSGSHERYKSEERLAWEEEFDCIKKMREWILETEVISEEKLDKLEKESKTKIKNIQKQAWHDYIAVFEIEKEEAIQLIKNLEDEGASALAEALRTAYEPSLKDIYGTV